MKTQNTNPSKLSLLSAIRAIKTDKEKCQILNEFENQHGSLTEEKLSEITEPVEQAFLEFEFLLPEEVSLEDAISIIIVWFCTPGTQVAPFQQSGVSIKHLIMDNKDEVSDMFSLDEIVVQHIQEYYVEFLILVLEEYTTNQESLKNFIKHNVSVWDQSIIVKCIRVQKLYSKGYDQEMIMTLLDFPATEVANYVEAWKERQNPLPYRNIFARKANLREFLICQLEKQDQINLVKCLNTIEEAENVELAPDIALQSLQNLWLTREINLNLN